MRKRRHSGSAEYDVTPYSVFQRFEAAGSQSVRHKPMIHGLLEVDVTSARAALREHELRTGEKLSFTAFLSACLAKAVDEHKAVQAFRQGARRLILFRDVDIATRVERDTGGKKFVTVHILRAANRKTLRQLHDEIRAAQTADPRRMLTRGQLMSIWLFSLLPTVLYKPYFGAFAWMASRNPNLWKQTMGTVGITAVGMFGTGAGWGIPATSPTSLMVTIGGIGEKQVIVDGRVDAREYLCLTISVDHDVIDGAPAARFIRRLKELIESGYGLSDALATSAQAEADSALRHKAGAARM